MMPVEEKRFPLVFPNCHKSELGFEEEAGLPEPGFEIVLQFLRQRREIEASRDRRGREKVQSLESIGIAHFTALHFIVLHSKSLQLTL